MMISNRLSTACLATLLTCVGPASYGNDIVDFLRAVNGPRNGGHHSVRHRGHYDRGHRINHYGGIYGVPVRHASARRFARRSYRPNRSFSLHIGRTPARHFPVVANPIFDQAPSPSVVGGLPHSIGEIVTCNVPLASHVRVRNAHEIAPAAQPIVVAVRDPYLAAWGSHGCVEQLAYVQVFAPPVPLRCMTVSPCHTIVELDYGDWEITVTAANGIIEVEYDD